MKSPLQEEEGPTPAKLCALYDVGGGVRLADSFAIYSVVALPPEWTTIEIDPIICSQLEKAASLVASNIPIISNLLDSPLPDLVSLPCPPRGLAQGSSCTNPVDHLPWFLIHASRYPKHCVFGRSDFLTSLLVVLQRPWCILELCCCDTPTIAALHELATLALNLDASTYRPALRLLAHELSRRMDGLPKLSVANHFIGVAHNSPQNLDSFNMYKELSRSSLRSHNSFWIGLISTCAVYLGLAFSDMTKMLGDLVSDPRATSAGNPCALNAKLRALSSHSASILPPGQAGPQVHNLATRRRHSIDVISHPAEDSQIYDTPALTSHADPHTERGHVLDILKLYDGILKGFREDI
ncbi:uncharacterized protein N7496_000026 [Penicillium cataractarum]|uniref:Uncharacterized protein n=1 Tax=Penicillium cataractarum TaxID=2100454 RepID=A0A9W9VTC6_9EURO|nr:uncharacterized protein N7496_000026 [Penicillium cataractarum]KAJ5388958.1 hypothetical protein N7496_000026 [Penicillium cataractarum]